MKENNKIYIYVTKNSMVLLIPGTEAEVESIISSNRLVVVDFSATWCGPCKVMTPKFEELSEKYSNSIVCVKVDIDQLADFASKSSIRSVPTFNFYYQGEVVGSVVGAGYSELANKMATFEANIANYRPITSTGSATVRTSSPTSK